MKIIKYIKAGGYVVLSLGMIHTAATPVIFKLSEIKSAGQLDSVFMFVTVGIAVIFTGLLQLFCIKNIDAGNHIIKILKGSVCFMLIMGLGAVLVMPDNPFAYISLVAAIYEWITIKMFIRKKELL